MFKVFNLLVLLFLIPSLCLSEGRAFSYTYESKQAEEGELEVAQWVTLEQGHQDTYYESWKGRTEFEYGITDDLTASLYLNMNTTRDDNQTSNAFDRFSFETMYRFSDQAKDPIGAALYAEVTSNTPGWIVEGKLILAKETENFITAFNTSYEAEWEEQYGETEHEAELAFTGGVAYKLCPDLSIGMEAQNKSAYPDGFNLSGQEFQSWHLGPVIHYDPEPVWFTLSFMPQIWGNGDGSVGNEQLVHDEKFYARLIVGGSF